MDNLQMAYMLNPMMADGVAPIMLPGKKLHAGSSTTQLHQVITKYLGIEFITSQTDERKFLTPLSNHLRRWVPGQSAIQQARRRWFPNARANQGIMAPSIDLIENARLRWSA